MEAKKAKDKEERAAARALEARARKAAAAEKAAAFGETEPSEILFGGRGRTGGMPGQQSGLWTHAHARQQQRQQRQRRQRLVGKNLSGDKGRLLLTQDRGGGSSSREGSYTC